MTDRLVRDLLAPVLLVLLGAALLVAVLGAWPPLVAVETGSMEPSIERGDLVIVAGVDGDGIDGDGDSVDGDVIVFTQPDDDGAPILHRVAFAVEAGEDWTRRGDPARIGGDCDELRHCPAPHDGYVTYGDANDEYDQSAGIAPVVNPAWIDAKAVLTVPYAGWMRLAIGIAIDRFGAVPVGVAFVGSSALLGGMGSVLLGRLREKTSP